jgi:hypothetical protein
MGMFDELGSAQAVEKGKWFKPGDYDLRVKQVIGKQTQKSGFCSIVAFEILNTTHPEFPVGSDASWVQPMGKLQIALSAIKEFMIALAGLKVSDKDKIKTLIDPIAAKSWEAACGAANPYAGMVIHLNAYERLTAQQKPFTVHAWSPMVGCEGQLDRMRAAAQGGSYPVQVTAPVTPHTGILRGYVPPGFPAPPPGYGYTVKGELVQG